jgi:hypothetical protein
VRRFSGQHLIENGTERVDVSLRAGIPFTGRLLRAHVVRGSQAESGFREPRATRRADREGDPEVGHEGPSTAEQNIGGLDVPVDDTVLVGDLKRVADLLHDPHALVDRQLSLAVQPRLEGFAFDEGHDVEEEATRLSRVE